VSYAILAKSLGATVIAKGKGMEKGEQAERGSVASYNSISTSRSAALSDGEKDARTSTTTYRAKSSSTDAASCAVSRPAANSTQTARKANVLLRISSLFSSSTNSTPKAPVDDAEPAGMSSIAEVDEQRHNNDGSSGESAHRV